MKNQVNKSKHTNKGDKNLAHKVNSKAEFESGNNPDERKYMQEIEELSEKLGEEGLKSPKGENL
jgi:hypothetical protein